LANQQNLRAAQMKMITFWRLHHTVVEKRTHALCVHRSQHMILSFLEKGASVPSQKELAKELRISPAAVAVMLKKMETDGYITREAGSDIRRNEIRITEKGQTALAETQCVFDEIDFGMLSTLSEEEVTVFSACLDKISVKLHEMNDERN